MKKGFVYRISSGDHDRVYYGSTTLPIEKRLKEHVKCYKAFLSYPSNTKRWCSAFYLFDKGIGTIKIELVREVEFETLNELRRIEGEVIKSDPNAVNVCIPGRTREERLQNNSEQINEKRRLKYQDQKQEISEMNKQRIHCPDCGAEISKGHLSRHRNNYCSKRTEENKEKSDKLKEYQRQYNSVKVQCPGCEKEYTRGSFKSHKKICPGKA